MEFHTNTNAVRAAVHRVGGATRASNMLGVSNASIYNWIKIGRIPNIELAQILANATRMNIDSLRPTKQVPPAWF
ncbi:hypothetical protein FEMY_14040 [Ferrovum myxofaciens]|uniref:HTH cro/C1-type domain-containing protein n=1 Tax=Ferrovum myxofaciens TaxID=416213 RepID=A0A149VXU3_9PROT|nr:transcriptional regulator [Ferrovum myxofaciens]KXW58053.1 hypothetical protein FEMY_14040 [Ferrovum myxofaciens]